MVEWRAAAELDLQRQCVVDAMALLLPDMPELEWLHAVPNSRHIPPQASRKLGPAGMRGGVADVFWPLARRTWHGLYLITKVEFLRPVTVGPRAGLVDPFVGRMSPQQIRFRRYLNAQGYASRVFRSWGEFRAIVCAYHAGGELPAEHDRDTVI